MTPKPSSLYAGFLVSLCLAACSPKAPATGEAAPASPIIGSWRYQDSGMNWEWSFAGLPGMLRSAKAAPGFDPTTSIALRFLGNDRMSWSFSTEVKGKQEFIASRLK